MTTKPKNHKIVEQLRCSSANEIGMFFHCGECLKSRPNGESPRSWSRLEIGFTPVGLQVWCMRHDINVVHIDFEGQKHPANMSTQQVKVN